MASSTLKKSSNGPKNIEISCSDCSYRAQSNRQLSRHKSIMHNENALKCVLCPFVTAYQTNLLRHRKDVHGICGSKGNKSCKFCGFVSEDNDTLIHHQIEFHQDILKSAQAKFAKELASAGGDESIAEFSANFESMSEELSNRGASSFHLNLSAHKPKKQKLHKEFRQEQTGDGSMSVLHNMRLQQQQQQIYTPNNGDEEEADEFDWKAGFVDNYYDDQRIYGHPDSVNTSGSSTPKSPSSLSKDNLPATRIRRQYSCNDCNFRTVNPREFLYHRRDGHGHKIKIELCPYCIYACQYTQKLQRHLLLVHGQKSSGAMVSPDEQHSAEEDNFSGRQYKKWMSSGEQGANGSGLLDNDISNSNFEPDMMMDDKNDSLNDDDDDFDPMSNFEMNLNEYDNNGDAQDFDAADNDKDDSINLECSACKINFGDIISAQKHFVKFHQHSDSKNIMNIKHGNESTPTPLTTSQRKVFDDIKNIHSCNYCGYKTRWISELERHVRVHSKEKPFKCHICDFKSKWKGDLNRHMQRYHSGAVPDGGESDASANYANGNSQNSDMSPTGYNHHDHHQSSDNNSHLKDSFMGDEGNYGNHNNSYECSMEVDEAEIMMTNGIENGDGDNSEDSMEHSPDGSGGGSAGTAKMYKCTYCDFMCSTASRFHVHYVQHLNTKPFQCSICGHRSNWEWDVTKHIKMKAQRDPNHAKARPVLIHDSGKRDYSKYSKFVVWVGQAEADLANHEASKIDFRAKRFRPDELGAAEDGMAIDDNLLMPEVCFEEVEGEAAAAANTSDNNGKLISPAKSKCDTVTSEGSSAVIKSVLLSRHANSRERYIFCEVCDFKHVFSRVMVAHMSSHSNCKPYACKQCSFESKWREVIINHNRSQHSESDPMDFEMRFRCVIDENGICRILKLSAEELAQLEQENATGSNSNQSNDDHGEPPVTEAAAAAPFSPAAPATTAENTAHSSLIEPNIYEEKAVIHCQLCPFLTTNHKKMSIHCRFHNPSKGALKCKYCPYFVNNREKLLRHQKLHQKHHTGSSNGNRSHSRYVHGNSKQHLPLPTFGSHRPSVLPCSICPFRAINAQVLMQHIKLHKLVKPMDQYEDQHQGQFNEALMEQSMEEKGNNDTANNGHYGNGYGLEKSGSLININNMKNGSAKKFSYVCSDCPAAFKSPGDFYNHKNFHNSSGNEYDQHTCPYCTYKARNKPQLCKHLYVHTSEYIAKRANSYPDGTKHLIGPQDSNGFAQEISFPMIKSQKFMKQGKVLKTVRKRARAEFPMKPVKVKLNSEENGKQKIVFNNAGMMASQEFLETKEYLQRINSGIKNRCMYRCSSCPAVFTKVNTLIFHMSLHDAKSEFTCDICSYSTNTEDNLNIHSLLHNLTQSQAALGYNFNYNCNKCPAGFSKRARLEKHTSLHGAKFNWKCDKCDYSVRYAATLVKHRALHLINPNFRANEKDDVGLGLLNLAEGDANATDITAAIPSNLKLKLNLKSICTNGSAVEEQQTSAESSDVGGDEENKSDDGEMVVEEEEDEAQEVDNDSNVDASPDELANEEEEEVEEEEEEDDDDDEVETNEVEENHLSNNIAIETK